MGLEFKISSGEYKVLKSGSVSAAFGNVLRFDFSSEGWNPLELEFVEVSAAVAKKKKLKRLHMDGADMPDGALRIQLFNWNLTGVMGTVDPILIGDMNSVEVFLHFRVNFITGSKDRTIHYTFFSKNKDKKDG